MAFFLPPAALLDRVARLWWLVLLTGIGWIVVAVVVLRFDYASVAAIAVLFGCLAIAVGITEAFFAEAARGWWKALHFVLAAVFVVIGVIAFFQPGGTFVGLAAVISFYFVFAGTWNLITGLWTRTVNDAWWVLALSGLVELGLGLWAAGYWSRSATLLIAFVGAMAMIRGVTQIVFAFRLHALHTALEPLAVS
jgi:uncharacterized membrane protein HdeD (DUF308 family)